MNLPKFTVFGNHDPYLQVSLNKGEKAVAVSGSMVMMTRTLTLKGKLQGGLIRSFIRKVAQEESAFLLELEAVTGDGEALLAPSLPGDIVLVEVEEGRSLFINDGCYIASSPTIELTSKMQSLGKALFGGTGGTLVMNATGYGTVAISGLGAITTFELDGETIVDHRHIVAWESGITYETTTVNPDQGLLAGLLQGATSGQGIVNLFRGHGKIYLCSRNRNDLLEWIGKDADKRLAAKKEKDEKKK